MENPEKSCKKRCTFAFSDFNQLGVPEGDALGQNKQGSPAADVRICMETDARLGQAIKIHFGGI